jgi:hypothetical protein
MSPKPEAVTSGQSPTNHPGGSFLQILHISDFPFTLVLGCLSFTVSHPLSQIEVHSVLKAAGPLMGNAIVTEQ